MEDTTPSRALRLVTYPDAQLLAPCREVVASDYETIVEALPEMEALCRAHGGYAIAANQVGLALRFFVSPQHRDLPLRHPRVVINPVLTTIGTDMARMAEGCLSLPGLRVSVNRPATVSMAYTTFADLAMLGAVRDATSVVEETFRCWGLWGRVVQHELEHISGRLCVESVDQGGPSAREAEAYMRLCETRAMADGRLFSILDMLPRPAAQTP